MTNKEIIEQILQSGLSEEDITILLKEYINGIKSKQEVKEEEKSFEEKNQELLEKNRKQAQETRERQAKRDEIYRKEAEEKKKQQEQEKKQQLYDLEVQDKANILSEIKNRNGERIYDVNNMSGYEIMSLYSDIEKNSPQIIEQARKSYSEKEQNNNVDSKENEAVVNKPVSPELNPEQNSETINSQNSNVELPQENAQNASATEEVNEGGQNNSTNDENTNEQVTEEANSNDIDLNPEGRRKVTAITRAKDFLKSKVDAIKSHPIKAITIGIAAIAAIIAAPTLAVAGVAGAGIYAVNQYNKGRKS